MRISNSAVCYTIELLKGAGIHYEESTEFDTLIGMLMTTNGNTRMVVDKTLPPEERILVALHMYAHVRLGHVSDKFGMRLEFIEEDRAHIDPVFIRQEDQANELVASWLRGEELAGPMGALAVSLNNAAAVTNIKIRLLIFSRNLMREAPLLKFNGRSSLASILAKRLRRAIDDERCRLSLQQLERKGMSLPTAMELTRKLSRSEQLPDSNVRASRVRELVIGDPDLTEKSTIQ